MGRCFNSLACWAIIVASARVLPAEYEHPNGREYVTVKGDDYYWRFDEFFRISESVVTPSIKWAKPCDQGPLKVLVVGSRACHRETIELAQRFSLDYETIIKATRPDELLPEPVAGGNYMAVNADPERIVQEYETKLNLDYDVIVLANSHWKALPSQYRSLLLGKVEKGMGLVLTYQLGAMEEDLGRILTGSEDIAGAELITGTIPAGRLPGLLPEDGNKKLVTAAGHGRGRIVLLSYPSDAQSKSTVNSLTPVSPEDRVLPAVLYDYYHSLVGKALIWASGRGPSQRIVKIGIPQTLAASKMASEGVVLRVINDDENARAVKVEIVVRSWDGGRQGRIVKRVDLPPGESSSGFSLPRSAGGGHFLDVWLKNADSQAVIDWASSFFEVVPEARVEQISLDQRSFLAGENVSGKVRVSGTWPGTASLRIEMKDSEGRVLARQVTPVEKDGTAVFTLAFKKPVAVFHEIIACLEDETGTVDVKRRPFALAGLRYDDFAFVLWGAGGRNNYRSRMIAAQARELGVDSSYAYGKTEDWYNNPVAYWTTKAGLSQFLYTIYVGRIGGQVKDPNRWRDLGRGMKAQARANRHLGAVGYSTGDEYYLYSPGRDFECPPSYLSALREHLKQRYHCLEDLNRAWKTDFKNWEGVVPDGLERAREKNDYTSWSENHAFQEWAFADLHLYLRKCLEAVHEGVPVGEEGMPYSNSYKGVDLEQFRSAATLVHGYERAVQIERIRSLVPGTALTGYWYGSYSIRDFSEPKMRWHPWNSLYSGMNSAWWWTAYDSSSTGAAGLYCVAFTPDLTPSNPFKWTMAEVRDIKRGPGKLLLHSQRRHDRIAILYSMPSIRAAAAHPDRIELNTGCQTYIGDLVSFEYAWQTLLEDLGLQYEYISYEDVKKGLLRTGEFCVLILPSCVAVSQGEAAAIGAFVRTGGTLIADVRPGIMDEWGNVLTKGRLDHIFGVHQDGLADVVPMDVALPGLQATALPSRLVNPAVTLAGGKAEALQNQVPCMIRHRFDAGEAILLNFCINDYYTHWHKKEEHSDCRFRPEGRLMRSLIWQCLRRGGITKPVEILDGTGKALIGCEAVFFSNQENLYLGLLYKPDIIDFVAGDLEWIRAHYELNPRIAPVPITVRLPRAYHVYDVRKERYLGFTGDFCSSINAGEALLFSLLPYRVDGLELNGPRRVELSAGRAERHWAEPVRFSVRLVSEADRPGLHCFRIDVLDPLGREVRSYGQNILAHGGKAAFCVPLALNDREGDWTIIAKDTASGASARRTFACTANGAR